MAGKSLNIKISGENKEFSVIFKGRTVLKHSTKEPLVYVSEQDPVFKMNPKYISYYKIKNNLRNQLSLTSFEIKDMTEEKESAIIDFDNLLRLKIRINENRLEIWPEILQKEKINSNQVLSKISQFTIKFTADEDEAIYGCGEQFSFLNLKGKKVPLWTQEPGIIKKRSLSKLIADLAIGAGGTWWSTYFPQPTFISSKNYFIHADSYAYAEFDFRKAGSHKLTFNEIPSKIIVDVKENALEILQSLTSYLGRQRPLPEWAMDGAILGIGGGLSKEDPDSVVSKVERAKSANTKIAAIWAEDWTGLRQFQAQTRLFWNWKYSEERYPDLQRYIQQLHSEGIRFLGYNNCFLMTDGDLYQEAKEKGFLVKDQDGMPYQLRMFSFYAVMLDLTNPSTWKWFKKIIKDHMIGIGLDGWMCDFAEYLPVNAKLYSKEDPHLHHNEYPVLWAKLNAEAVAESHRDSGQDSIVFFSRSGNYATSKYSPLIWAGDQSMDFAMDMGFPASICAGISMGFIGIGQTHADIAGEFRFPWMKRTKDLFMRSTEYAAFTCVMRTHEAKGASGWTLDSDEETLNHFAKCSRIHAKLKAYLTEAIKEYQESGVPVIRHAYFHYEDDPMLHSKKPRLLQYQYMLGRDLFVAPVYQKKSFIRRLYLPKDDWIHLWSGKELHGGWVVVSAPYGEIPVFYRKQSKYVALFEELKTI